MPAIQDGVVILDMQWFASILVSIIVLGGSAIIFLIKYIFSLHKKQFESKAAISTFKTLVSSLEKDGGKIKADYLKLQKEIDEQRSQEAIFAKYEVTQGGVLIHKSTKRPYCPGCWHSGNKEVQLQDEPRDDFWRCPVRPEHFYQKPGRRGY